MIHIVMGKPGAGKSTYLAIKALEYKKKNKNVYSNVYIDGTYRISLKTDLNVNKLENGLLIIDEAGFEFNARDFKKFTTELYRFFTLHRHYNLDIILAVQFWDRLDIVIRELVQRITVITPTIFSFIFVRAKDITCSIDISEEGQIIEKFSWIPFLFGGVKYHYHKRARKLFNSYYQDDLNVKDFEIWKN